jgi:18S rRNA (guanine1575-N7)-methyltransferase
MSRPEHTAPPEVFYGTDEAAKYTRSSRILAIQRQLAHRAVELLGLPTPQLAAVGNSEEYGDDAGAGQFAADPQQQQGAAGLPDGQIQSGAGFGAAMGALGGAGAGVALDSRLILDVGCGSGLSGDVLTELGHEWLGVDISEAMLNVAVERETAGDLVLGDAGCGMPFRPG